MSLKLRNRENLRNASVLMRSSTEGEASLADGDYAESAICGP